MKKILRVLSALALIALIAGFTVGCGDSTSTDDEVEESVDAGADSSDSSESSEESEGSEAAADEVDGDVVEDDPTSDVTIAATHSILADVVTAIVGDQAEVLTVIPAGLDPHDFRPSAQGVDELVEADALIVNGAAFEEAFLDVVESVEADGVPVYEAIEGVATIEYDGEHDHGDDDHGDEDHDEHGHDGLDPHFFNDPSRMADSVQGISDFLAAEVSGLDADQLAADTAAYIDELEALDAEAAELLGAIPEEDRVMVTNHEVFGYFADRYDFEVVGAIIPSGSTNEGVGPKAFAELAEQIESEGVPAIFIDSTAASSLAETLADEVDGGVEIVELYTESLGDAGSDAETYIGMVTVNVNRVAEALAP